MDVAQGASRSSVNVAAYGYGSQSTFTGSTSLGPSRISTSVNGDITPPDLVKNELNGVDSVERSGKIKQKRNKPTLSCLECVERKASQNSVPHGTRANTVDTDQM